MCRAVSVINVHAHLTAVRSVIPPSLNSSRHFSPFVHLSFLLHLLSLKKQFFLIMKKVELKANRTMLQFSSVPSGDAVGSVRVSDRLASMTSL